MDSNVNEAICISLYTYGLGKGMNLFFLPTHYNIIIVKAMAEITIKRSIWIKGIEIKQQKNVRMTPC